MPPAAAAVVGAFGLTGATAAVVGAAVTGALTGTVIGAATSLISGKNVFKGALKGAAIGGLTAGVLSGASIGLHSLTNGAIGMSAEAQLGAMGISQAGNATSVGQELGSTLGTNLGGGLNTSVTSGLPSQVSGLEGSVFDTASTGLGSGMSSAANTATGLISPTFNQGVESATTGILPTAGNTVTGSAPVTGGGDDSGFLGGMFKNMSDSQSKVMAGVGQGVAQGAGSFLSAGEQAKALKAQQEQARKYQLEDIENNKVGSFAAKVARIEQPDWWVKHLSPEPAASQIGATANA